MIEDLRPRVAWIDAEAVATLSENEDGESLAGAYAMLCCGLFPSDRSIDRLEDMGVVERGSGVVTLTHAGAPPATRPEGPVSRGVNAREARRDGEWFLAAFLSDLRRNRRERPNAHEKEVTSRFERQLKTGVDQALAGGRDETMLRRAVSRLALRYDEYPWLSVADAVNDVLSGKPYTPEMEAAQERGEAEAPEVPDAANPEDEKTRARARRREGYEWLFGEDGG